MALIETSDMPAEKMLERIREEELLVARLHPNYTAIFAKVVHACRKKVLQILKSSAAGISHDSLATVIIPEAKVAKMLLDLRARRLHLMQACGRHPLLIAQKNGIPIVDVDEDE